MIKKWIPFETVVDNLFDEITPIEYEGFEDSLKRIALRAAYALLDRCEAPKSVANPITGKIKNGGIDLPEDCANPIKLKVENQTVLLQSKMHFLRNSGESFVYKAKIVGERIMFSVVGGANALEGKEYKLEYEAYPLLKGVLYITFEFEQAIIEHIRYILLRQKIESAGRGQGLLRTAYDIKEKAAQNAVSDVDFPSWDEWIQIGKIWESKVPLNLERGNREDFKEI